MGNQLSLTNVVNISVSQAQAGAGEYNTSNIGLFTPELPEASFGALGYKIYIDPIQVGTDFGTDSTTYQMANAVFSQAPNILAANGYLAIVPFKRAVENIIFNKVAVSGEFIVYYNLNAATSIHWDDSLATIQSKLRAVAGLEGVVVSGSIASKLLQISFDGAYSADPILAFSLGSNTLEDSLANPVMVTFETANETEGLAESIARTESLVQYFGIMSAQIETQIDMLSSAAVVQPLNKIAGFVSRLQADVQPGGKLDLLRTGNFSKSRGLYYGSDGDTDALIMMAAYFGRFLSTNFSGSNTTSTMHLKDLNGVQPDPSMSQSLLTLCQDAGADVYVSLQSVPKVFCSGANMFADQVYNAAWFAGALQIAGFNFLAQAATKVPQTESGMDGLKSAYRAICEQAVTNQYSAPGKWNSSTTFGNQADFLANITQKGYYIYSQPVAQQAQAQRALREAPLVQIALKEAGAIHSSTVIVYINA